MNLGFVSAILPDLSLEEVLNTAAEIGYDCVEVMCWPPGKAERRYAGITHIEVTDFDPDAVKGLVVKTGVQISGLGYYPNALSPNLEEAEVAVRHIRAVMQAAHALGLSRFNTFIGRDYTQSVEANWPRVMETWRPLVAEAEQLHLRVGIENCPMLFTGDEWPGGKNIAVSPAIWRRLFADLNSNAIGLNYDPSHLVWQMMDPIQPLVEFRDRLVHVHAKDARIDRHKLNEVGILAAPLDYHTPKLPGLGEVDWGRFFSVLGDVGYTGPVCVEVEDRPYETSLEARLDALRQSYRYLRQFVSPRGH
jgi:sugar phosphate isomerase/epimerase